MQRFEEVRTKLSTLHEQHSAGKLSAEALKAAEQELEGAIADAQTFLERARQLNTIDRGRAELEALAESKKPEYLRPMGGGETAPGSPAGRPEQLAPNQPIVVGGVGLSERQLLNVSRIAGVQPHQFQLLQGRDRAVLNRWVRGNHLPKEERCNAQELAHLNSRAATASTGGIRENLNVNPYIDRDGGYITAAEMRNEVIGHLRDRRHIRTRARVIPTNAGTVAFPSWKVSVSLKKTRAHKGKVDGSSAASIRDVLGKTEFVPSGRMEIVKVPEELVEDLTFDLLGFLSEEIAMQAFDDEEGLFLTGSGVNEPYGVLSAPIPGVAHTGAGNADFKPEDIKTLPFEIREVFRTGAVWMANRAFYKAVAVMRSDSGAGAGTGEFLFQQGLRAGDPATIGGYETLESEFFPNYVASGSAGDPMCLFGDWRHFWIVDRLTMEIKVLDTKYADEMQIGFRYRKRLDAAPVRLESWVTLDRK